MNSSNDPILVGLPVHTVAEIAESAGALRRVSRFRPDGRVSVHLARGEGRIVEGTEVSFPDEALAVAHMENLVSACVTWQDAHRPHCVADPGFFTC